MSKILGASPGMGKVLQTRDYANHIVIERDTEPPLICPEPYPHWIAQTFAGRWQLGWVLADPVRLTEPCRPAPVQFLADVVAHLERTHQGKRAMRYMNPNHPDIPVQMSIVDPSTLRDLARQAGRAKGGRSRSEAKLDAARQNLSQVNEERASAGYQRTERFEHLRAGGLTVAEVAAREGVTVNAVKCALKRARRADAAEVAEAGLLRAEWQARLSERAEVIVLPEPETMRDEFGWPLSWWDEEQQRAKQSIRQV